MPQDALLGAQGLVQDLKITDEEVEHLVAFFTPEKFEKFQTALSKFTESDEEFDIAKFSVWLKDNLDPNMLRDLQKDVVQNKKLLNSIQKLFYTKLIDNE